MKASDLKGVRVGGQPRQFGQQPRPSAPSRIANVRFQIRNEGKIITVDAKFATSEKLTALYEFLEQEVFESVQGLEIMNSFPRMILPRDDTLALAGQQITGQVILQVNISGPAKLKQIQ